MCGTNTKTTSSSTASQSQNSAFSQNYGYDPQSMSTYQGLLPGIGNVLNNYMTDPLKSGFFNKAFALSNNLIGQQGQTAQSNLLKNLGQRGLTSGGNVPLFGMAQQGQIQRATSGQQGSNLTNLLLGYSQNQLKATGMAQSFNPLVTGVSGTGSSSGTSQQDSNSLTSTSGLGTWLPQLLAAGIGGASGLAGMFGGNGGTSSGAGYGTGNNNVYSGGTGGQTTQMGVPYQPSFPSIPAPATPNAYLSGFNYFGLKPQ